MSQPPFPTQEISSVPPAEAQRLAENGALFVDVREFNEWEQVRIRGATFLPLSQINDWYESLDRERTVILYCRTGNRSGQATAALTHQADFHNVVNMEGGIVEWYEEGLPVDIGPAEIDQFRPPFETIDPELAHKEIANGDLRWVVDVRSPLEYASGHIPGARNIPFDRLPLQYSELPRGEPVLVSCDRGEISTLAARLLADLDFSRVLALDGGMEAWRYRDLPLDK